MFFCSQTVNLLRLLFLGLAVWTSDEETVIGSSSSSESGSESDPDEYGEK